MKYFFNNSKKKSYFTTSNSKNLIYGFWMVLLFFLNSQIFSQSVTLAGIVTDENNIGMEGVILTVNDGKYQTITDSDGKFNIISITKGNYHIDATIFGYTTLHLDLNLKDSQKNLILQMVPGTLSLNEIEIHADATVRKQKETSLNIEVVNEDYIRNNLKMSLMKSLEDIPGVTTIDVGSGQSKPVIRGLSFNQVAVVENGIKHEGQQWGEDHGLEIDPYSVQNVEIIKGPSSLLYGSDAIGGIVLIDNSSIPMNDGFKSELNLNTKSFNSSYGGSLNISKRKKALYYDGRISYNDYGDYKVPVDQIDIYSYKAELKDRYLRNTAGKDLGLHSQLGYVSNKQKTILFLSWFNSDNAFFANAHGLEPRFVNTALHDKNNRDIQEPHQQTDHLKGELNSTIYTDDGSWNFELGYQKNLINEYSGYVNHGYMPAILPEDSGIAANLERSFNKDVISANIKRELIFENFKFNTGINSEYQNNKINGWSFIIPEFQRWTGGVFAFGKYRLNNVNTLNGGIRYDIGRLKSQEYQDWFQSEKTDGTKEYLIRSGDFSKTYHALSWALGYVKNKDHFSLKVNIGKSFRMPIAKEIGANGVNYHHFSYEKGNPELKPETSYQLDLGLEWNYKKWAFKISPFANYFTNYIYLNPTSDYDFLYGAGNQIYVYTQAEVMRYGGEIHCHYNFLKNLTLDLMGEYVYSQQLSGTKKGFGLPFAPPGNIISKLNYDMQSWKWLNKSVFTLSHKYTFAQNNIVPPEEKTPGSSVWDIAFQTEIKLLKRNFQFQFQINNVLNTKYFNHTNYYRIIGVPEPGRNLTVSMKIPLID
jgi:iron complex outermembrane recepter protein